MVLRSRSVKFAHGLAPPDEHKREPIGKDKQGTTWLPQHTTPPLSDIICLHTNPDEERRRFCATRQSESKHTQKNTRINKPPKTQQCPATLKLSPHLKRRTMTSTNTTTWSTIPVTPGGKEEPSERSA
ncbi:UNVERIFIED_CONTAM: hypothetical protein FKN15_052380 [Acipenser sinensis]